MDYCNNFSKTLKAYKNIAYSFIVEFVGDDLTTSKANSLAEKIALAILEYEKNKK